MLTNLFFRRQINRRSLAYLDRVLSWRAIK